MNPKISIIIPIYNAEKYLYATLDSIVKQDFKDFEVLLIDDGSNDSSAVICKTFIEKDKRFLYFRKENGGVSSARNYGLEKATGKFISFVDNDDYMFPDFLETMINNIDNYDLLISNYLAYQRNEIVNRISSNYEITIGNINNFEETFPQLARGIYTIWNQMYRKEIIEKNHLHFENITHEDEIFSYNYILHCNSIKRILFQGYLHYYNHGSLGNSHKYIANLEVINRLYDTNKKIINKFKIKDESYFNRIHERYGTMISSWILRGYFKDTKTNRCERIRRWKEIHNTQLFNDIKFSALNTRSKFLFFICKYNLYTILDPLINATLRLIQK